MTEFLAGPTMVLQWITSTYGTIDIKPDYQTLELNPTIAYVDVSAGSDTQTGRLTALKDITASLTLLMQTGGTQIAAAFQPGQAGTLICGPEGTATNKRKITLPCYSDGAKLSYPYAGAAQITCGLTGAGSILNNFTDGVY